MGKSLKGNIRVWSCLLWSLKPERKWVGKNLIIPRRLAALSGPALCFSPSPLPVPTGGYICVSVVVPKIHLFGLLSDFFLYRVCLFFSFSISLWIFRVKDYVCMCMCLYLISFNKQRGKTVPKCCAKHLLSNLLSRVDTMFPIFFMRKVKLRQVNVTPPKVR